MDQSVKTNSFEEFLTSCKSYTIAPAGYGKTHSIAECIKYLSIKESKPILVLTHTHAGIASINEKLYKAGISKDMFDVETIISFAQRYVKHLIADNSCLPPQESKEYFGIIIEKASELIKCQSVKTVIKCSYSHLFADEYQDCTVGQHNLIMAMSDILPTHILGDPLQGIYGFNGENVDMNSSLPTFSNFNILNKPWRWCLNGNSPALGETIAAIREQLLTGNELDLSHYESDSFVVVKGGHEYADYNEKYFSYIRDLLLTTSNSTLIIVPQYQTNGIFKGKADERAALKSRIDFRGEIALIEAIDDPAYYKAAKDIDELITSKFNNCIKYLNKSLISLHFKSVDIGTWIKNDKLISKRGASQAYSKKLSEAIKVFQDNPSSETYYQILLFFIRTMKYKSKRQDILDAALVCCKRSMICGKSVYNSMIDYKNKIRREGRIIDGKCIGTTLLTKGLEFDTVLLLDAHRFSDKNNFYVAISRACKKLIILTKDKTLHLR